MDETIKLYKPTAKTVTPEKLLSGYTAHNTASEAITGRFTVKIPKTEKKESKISAFVNSKWKSRFDTLREVFNEQKTQESYARFRNPWVDLFYNWLIALLMVAMVIGFISWGLDIKTRNEAEAIAASAMAEYQATQEAERVAEQQRLAEIAASEETIMKNEATNLARVFYGIRNFIEKYHYSDNDMITYAWCIFNRVESKGYGSSVEEVVTQKDQWVGYYDNNPVIDQYYKMAYNAVQNWHRTDTRPVSSDYLWAELTPNGIYLKNDFNADGYARRWHYGQ